MIMNLNPEKTLKQLSPTQLLGHMEAVRRNSLNKSTAKMQYSFQHSDRFDNHLNSFSPSKYYNLPQIRSKKATSFGYGCKVNFGKHKLLTPAPGAYDISIWENQDKYKNAGYLQEIIANNMFYTGNASKPDCCTYNIGHGKGSSGITMRPKVGTLDNKWQKNVPGPGNYQHGSLTGTDGSQLVSKFSTAPMNSFTNTKRFTTVSTKVPGPGNYEPQKSIDSKLMKHMGGRISIGRGNRSNLGNIKILAPGPGTYPIFSQFVQ